MKTAKSGWMADTSDGSSCLRIHRVDRKWSGLRVLRAE
jgi:hypothetical protein